MTTITKGILNLDPSLFVTSELCCVQRTTTALKRFEIAADLFYMPNTPSRQFLSTLISSRPAILDSIPFPFSQNPGNSERGGGCPIVTAESFVSQPLALRRRYISPGQARKHRAQIWGGKFIAKSNP